MQILYMLISSLNLEFCGYGRHKRGDLDSSSVKPITRCPDNFEGAASMAWHFCLKAYTCVLMKELETFLTSLLSLNSSFFSKSYEISPPNLLNENACSTFSKCLQHACSETNRIYQGSIKSFMASLQGSLCSCFKP